jgi:RNA recognition motif-containing protein
MEAKIWISNLTPGTTAEQLSALFAEYGEVLEAIVSEDPEEGKTTYNALVNLNSEEGAADAIEELEGYKLNKRPLQLDWFGEEDDDYEDEWGDDGDDDDDEGNDAPRKGKQRYAEE